MTYKRFKLEVQTIQKEYYKGLETEPVEFAIARAKFECCKLQRLISLSKTVRFRTAKEKAEGWHRELERRTLLLEGLEQRRAKMLAFEQQRKNEHTAAPPSKRRISLGKNHAEKAEQIRKLANETDDRSVWEI